MIRSITQSPARGFQKLGDWPGASKVVAQGLRIYPTTLDQGGTNLLPSPEDFTAWTSSATADVTANDGAAADGTTTADLIDDASASQLRERSTIVSVPNDSNQYYLSGRLEGVTSDIVEIDVVFLTGGTTVECSLIVDLSDGSTTNRSGGGYQVPANVAVTNITGSIWDISFGASNNGTGNTNCQVYLRPAWNTVLSSTLSVGATGAVRAWGFKLAQETSVSRYSPASEVVIPGGGIGWYLECTTGGTTGALEPIWPVVGGNTIADGSAVWTVRGPYRDPGYLTQT